MTATVLIADDHELVRTGIRRLLEDCACEVVAEAATGEQAIALAREHEPDIALIDIHMPGIGGFEATQKIRRIHPDCRVIILTAYTEGPLPRTLLEVGVAGFLTKGCAFAEMDEALTTVRNGGRYISRELAQKLALDSLDGDASNPFERLTSRELQVALMLLGGEVNRDISQTLQLSPKTVTTYRQRILRKAGARSLTELLRLAIQYNLTSPDRDPALE